MLTIHFGKTHLFRFYGFICLILANRNNKKQIVATFFFSLNFLLSTVVAISFYTHTSAVTNVLFAIFFTQLLFVRYGANVQIKLYACLLWLFVNFVANARLMMKARACASTKKNIQKFFVFFSSVRKDAKTTKHDDNKVFKPLMYDWVLQHKYASFIEEPHEKNTFFMKS